MAKITWAWINWMYSRWLVPIMFMLFGHEFITFLADHAWTSLLSWMKQNYILVGYKQHEPIYITDSTAGQKVGYISYTLIPDVQMVW